jgi:nucleoside-diphosphate-sugar epimerase
MLVPDNELFRINTQSSYNIIESACKLGIKKIILASSITVYGVSYAEGDVPYPLFPVDEDCATEPADVYATSKLCMERVAASFARRFPSVDIYVLRIGAVVSPDLYYDKIALYRSAPEKWKAHGWSYSDARDLGNMVHCCLQKDGLGYQVFNAVNDEATFDEETEGFLKRVCPETEVTRSMEKHEAPISNGKIREMLGFEEEFGWRKLLGVNKSKERKQEVD